MHSDYRTPIIRQLRDQQVRFAPRDKKISQAARAEKLLHEIEPEREYPYDYLCYRITNFRPDADSRTGEGGVLGAVLGEQLQHDLRLFVEDVSDAADLTAEEAGEDVLTVEQLSERFNVSTKTIARWRQQGLVSRRFVLEGRKRVGFLHSSVERFVTEHQERVQRGGKFSQMTEREREEVVSRARRIAQEGHSPHEVARRTASEMGRSVETIRYTLREFDEEHPDLAVFPQRSAPLSDFDRERICDLYKQGRSVEELAERFGRTRTSVYRIVNEVWAKRLAELPLDCIYNEQFDSPSAEVEAEILGPTPQVEESHRKSRTPAGLPPYLASLYDIPLLTREQEAHLFRKMNYLKYRAAKLREQLDPARPRATLMERVEREYDEAQRVKNEITRANLRLVVSIAKRHVGPNDDFFELISDGNMSLIRAVEKFDYARGNKFSTYATWAIMKNFARSIPDDHKRRLRFRTSLDEMFESTVDGRSDQFEQESAQNRRENDVEKILDRLDEREQSIIIKRFGLEQGHEPLTLKEVGEQMGVTKERVRQIEARALSKLRKAAEEERIEDPN